MTQRRAGLLLPVSALPSRFGIGDFGPAAREWITFLGAAGQKIWQVLPLNVADGFGCPYASPTGFATDPVYLSPEDLLEEGRINAAQLPPPGKGPVDWEAVRKQRGPFLRAAADALAEDLDLAGYLEEQPWARAWGRFAVQSEREGTTHWWKWSRPAPDEDDPDVRRAIALQWGLDRQWARLCRLARAHGVQMWGDLPFFVGGGSADVWSQPELFDLNPDGTTRMTTGVPPDAFSADGQRWGHPHFKREAHVAENWTWALARAQRALDQVDVLRLDHFRGLHEVWEIPGDHDTAAHGRWIPGPGRDLLDPLLERAPAERWVAEDLGVITDEVRALRDDYGLRGMAILQFAFGSGGDSPFLPHNHRRDQVVYTGTHDNSTLVGWASSASPQTLEHAARYLGCHTEEVPAAIRRAAWRSVADTAILPLQDVLELGDEARFNLPGTHLGNWIWRVRRAALTPTLAGRLAEQAILSDR